jgi:ABC-2 type transport system permease protein
MTGFGRLAFVESKLFLREKAALLGVFGLPVALVIGFGLIPGFGDPQKGLSNQIGTEYIASVGVAIVLATLGLTGAPMVIGQYRERGVLRRLAVTPVRPLTLLMADVMVWAASGLISVALVVAVARAAFHVPAPHAAGWFLLSVVLGIASLLAVGLFAAAVAPTARGAAGIGWLLFFPNMFLAGVYLPTEEMSSTMRQIGNFTPLGSALHAVRDSWMGIDPRPEYLGIMAAWALVAGALAARFFRWDKA